MSIKFLVLEGGGYSGFWGGGGVPILFLWGECRFYFYGARIFSDKEERICQILGFRGLFPVLYFQGK